MPPLKGRFPVNIDLECETEGKVRVRLSNFSGISLTTKIHGCFTAKGGRDSKEAAAGCLSLNREAGL